jgi:putative tryptophan/tyrosine transport system substrate-binding protein
MRRREFITLLGGGAAAWPLAARAELSAKRVIGFLSGRSPDDSGYLVAAFHRGLAEDGFVEGENVAIEYRWALGNYGRLPELAAELVKRQVDVLVGVGGDASALAAKAATSTIPVVFDMGGDPVTEGMVASLNRPGGNATGVTVLTSQLISKRLGLLHELVPKSVIIAGLINPNAPTVASQLQELDVAAGTIGLRLVIFKASNDAELDAAFSAIAEQSLGGLLVGSDPYFDTQSGRIIAFALNNRLPAIYQFREYTRAGGLLSYGVDLTEAYRQCGVYAAKILKGAKPADLPVQQVVKFELVINLKAAKAIGFEFPPTFSARADEVIE